MTSAAIYARVSSARQAKDETIGSQLAALRDHAASNRLDVPQDWVFADEGHSGATLVRPGLEALRDLAAQGCLDVVLVYSPDRLARKFAYQALLIEELARCGVRVEFVKGPRGDSPEDQLLVQFQGMFAEYEKAQLAERYRRGKAWRAKSGSVNVLSGAPFGYRYVRKTPESGARYEVVPHEAALVTEMFRRYADDGASIADLRRWLTGQGVRTRTGKERWDRSVIWGMLRNPAYAGTAVFGKTQAVHEPAGLNRTARLAGRTVPRQVRVEDRPREEWTAIPVPALVDEDTFDRVQQRLAGNKRFAARNTKVPSLLQGLAACASCGYGYYRTSTTTSSGKKIYYYRCLGSDDYRYQGGRVCGNKPVRADYVDAVVWDHVTALLADPALIRAEIDKRLERARTSDPVTKKRGQLSRPSPRPARRSPRWSPRSPSSSSPSTSSAPACRTSAPAKPGSKTRSPPSTPRPPTATPTSSSPTTSRASSESSARTRPPPPPKTASASCAPSSRTSSSAPRNSPSATASPSGNHPAAAATTTPPTRRVTCAKVRCCVGGVTGPPCGAPVTSRRTCPPSITPARSIARRSIKTAWSLTRSSTARINLSCGIAEKQFTMSVSTTHRRPCQASSTRTWRASCADRFGRNPKLHGRKSASKTGSSTIFIAACTIRSRTAAIASGLRSILPGLGISTFRAGSGRHVPACSSLASSPSSRVTPYSSTSAKVVLSMPGAPLLRRTACHARCKTSSR